MSGASRCGDEDLLPEQLAPDVREGAYHLAFMGDEVAGTVKLQLSDPSMWPEAQTDEAVYVHRLAVRRRFAGGRLSTALLRYAEEQACAMGRTHLRLDCDGSRARLRLLYVSMGFRHHSDHVAGAFQVARFEKDVLDPMSRPRREPQ